MNRDFPGAMNDADDIKEAKLLTLYQELTGACEAEARSTLMFVESAPELDAAPAHPIVLPDASLESGPAASTKAVPNPPLPAAGQEWTAALSEPAV
jgi:hypothetical protein